MPPPPSIRELLASARRRWAAAPPGASPREAALLLGHVLGLGEAALLARDDQRPDEDRRRQFLELLERRLAGEPVAYLTGEREFYGRSFHVDARVLIPRPETELLFEAALERLPVAGWIADVGTGSGCLAVSLAAEAPAARVLAIDRSPAALAVAAANARRHGVRERVRLLACDLASALVPRHCQLVIANLPYIPEGEAATLPRDVADFEPPAALYAGTDGLQAIAGLLDGLPGLAAGTPVLLEFGAGQLDGLRALLATRPYHLTEVRPDLAGHPRVAVLTAA